MKTTNFLTITELKEQLGIKSIGILLSKDGNGFFAVNENGEKLDGVSVKRTFDKDHPNKGVFVHEDGSYVIWSSEKCGRPTICVL